VFRGAADVLNRTDAPIILFERNRKATQAFGFTVSAPSEFLLQLPRPEYALYQIEARARVTPTTPDAAYHKVSNLLAVASNACRPFRWNNHRATSSRRLRLSAAL
jgi:hypothetical protein